MFKCYIEYNDINIFVNRNKISCKNFRNALYIQGEIRSVMAINFQALEHANLVRHVFPYSVSIAFECEEK